MSFIIPSRGLITSSMQAIEISRTKALVMSKPLSMGFSTFGDFDSLVGSYNYSSKENWPKVDVETIGKNNEFF